MDFDDDKKDFLDIDFIEEDIDLNSENVDDLIVEDDLDAETENNTDILSDIDSDHDDDFVEDEPELKEPVVTKLRRKKCSIPKLSIFERTKMLSFRSQQLANNAKPRIDIEDMKRRNIPINPYNIAIEELKQGVIPFKVRRDFSDGTYEMWSLKEFKFI